MRAIVVREAGGPEVLEFRDLPEPDPGFGQIRIRVRAAGINRADLLQRAGFYPAPKGVPADILGLEYAGVVDAVGEGTSRFRVGDRVFGLVAGGAYAEKVVVHEREAVAIPEGMGDEEAAAIPEVFVTAWDALLVRGGLRPGERVLVQAVGSGVGTAGAQIAAALGCEVIGTSRTADKLERAREFGMSRGVLVGGGGEFADEVTKAGGGVDVVLELVGGAYVAEDIKACATLGRIVVVGLSRGARSEINLGALLAKRVTIVGTVLRARPLEEKIEAARLLERQICPLLQRGRLKPVIDRVYRLEQAAEAHEYLASNASFGKVLVTISEPSRAT